MSGESPQDVREKVAQDRAATPRRKSNMHIRGICFKSCTTEKVCISEESHIRGIQTRGVVLRQSMHVYLTPDSTRLFFGEVIKA